METANQRAFFEKLFHELALQSVGSIKEIESKFLRSLKQFCTAFRLVSDPSSIGGEGRGSGFVASLRLLAR